MRLLALTLVALAVAASASARDELAAGCTPSFAARLETGSATQLITVVARTRASTQGSLRLWTKRAGCWRQSAGPWTAWLGQRGTSPAKREGDRRTPTGIFGFLRTMYGIAPSPGVHYGYRRVVCGDWWVEDRPRPRTTASATSAAARRRRFERRAKTSPARRPPTAISP